MFQRTGTGYCRFLRIRNPVRAYAYTTDITIGAGSAAIFQVDDISPSTTPAEAVYAVTGAGGMLGSDVVAELGRRGLRTVALGRDECDVKSAEDCSRAIGENAATVVINCAAYTDVNGAESAEPEAMLVNAVGAGNVATACANLGARCIYVSTDYVFDGTKTEPYEPSDSANPLNVYGRSKLAGEQAVKSVLGAGDWTVVRTSWLYGKGGPNFVKTMLHLAREKKDLKVINDQTGAPTYTADLARVIVEVAVRGIPGTVHATATGACTWYEFALQIFRQSGVEPASIAPCLSSEYPSPATRPANSRLSNTSLQEHGIELLPSWQDGLSRYLKETGELKQV